MDLEQLNTSLNPLLLFKYQMTNHRLSEYSKSQSRDPTQAQDTSQDLNLFPFNYNYL